MKLFRRIKNWCWYKYHIILWRKYIMNATVQYNNNPTPENQWGMMTTISHYQYLLDLFENDKKEGLA